MINKLDVYRAGVIISSFDIDTSTVFNEKLQGTRLISCPVSTVENIDIQEEDYIIFEDEEFSVNLMSDREKDGAVLSQKISVNFEAAFYKLLDVYVKSSLGAKKFPFYGTALEHCQMIINSANQVGSGWFIIEVDNTNPVTIEYDFTYVRTALDIISEATGLEWDVKGKGLKMVESIGRDTGLVFELGRGKGLHQIKRSPDASKNVITRAYGQGGSRNITSKYRGGLYNNLIFEGEFVQTPGVTAGTQRVKEGRYTNEKIFPQFKGTITATTVLRGSDNKIISTTITDTSIDFNINDHMQEGVKAKVSFLTGVLSGNEFEIEKYVHATRTITLINSTDANGYIRPNDLNLPEIGNKFTLLDMNMPVEYVTRAENELKTETQEFLNENEFQRLLYGAKPDPKVLRGSNIRLRAGDRATVKDISWKVNEVLRFTEITFPLVNRFDVTAIVGNEIRYDKTVKLIADVIQANKQVQEVDRKSEMLAKRGVQNLRAFELSIFNPDGKLNADRYDVGVLTTLLAIIGTKSQNFRLNKVYITDNFGGNANSVSISLGELVHFEYANPGNQNIWQLQPVVQAGLTPDKLYYVYCKCSTTNQSGTFVVTTEQIKPEDIAGFWMFLAGVIYPVLDGYRNSDFTNGIADITAARIKIGKIISRDGLTGFDLDNSTIFGKINFRSSAGTLKDIKDVDSAASNALTNAATAQNAASNAQTAANAAKSQSDAALIKLSDISNDSILDTGEKPSALKDIREIIAEYPGIISQANAYGLSSVDYNSKYEALITYLSPLLVDMNVNSTIDRTNFISQFANYYNTRQAIYTAVTNKAKQLSDSAQNTAGNAINNAATAQTVANEAKIQADSAIAKLSDISSDGIIDVSEKNDVKQKYQAIQGEYASVMAQAAAYGINVNLYNYNYATSVLNNNIPPLLVNMNANSPVDREIFNAWFVNYYNAKQAVLAAITNAAKGLIDGIQIGGRNYLINGSFGRNPLIPPFSLQDTAYNCGLSWLSEYGGILPRFGNKFLQAYKLGAGSVPYFYFCVPTFSVSADTDYVLSYFHILPFASNGLNITLLYNSGYYETIAQHVNTNYTWGESNVLKFKTPTNVSGLTVRFDVTTDNWFLVDGIQVEKGTIKTDFMVAPEDLQVDLDKAKTDATKALQELSDISNDGILDVSEKVTLFKDYLEIIGEKDALIAQALPYGVSTADYNGNWNVVRTQLESNWLKDLTVSTQVDRVYFNNVFKLYYASKVNLLKTITDAAKGLFDNIQIGGTNTFGLTSVIEAYAGALIPSRGIKGFSVIGVNSNNAQVRINNVITSNGWWTISFDAKVKNVEGWPGTIDFCDGQSFALVYSTSFKHYEFTFNVQNWTSNLYTFIDINDISAQEYQFDNIKVEKGNKASAWSPSPVDVSNDAQNKATNALNQANTFADSVSTTKANAAQANALSGASNDASNKMTNAYNNAVAASNTYANTVSNSAASTAQTAAAADASNKATQAYNNAVAAANTAYNNLTGALGPMAYRSVQLAAGQGVTVIDNGSVLTFLVDTAYVRANVVNVGYITGLDLNFVKGTIGGILIQGNSIASSNGSFSVTSTGLLTASNANITGTINATAGNIAGFNISGDRLTKGQLNTPGQNYVNISPGSFQYQKSWPGGGGSNFEFNGVDAPGVNWAASIGNGRVHDEINIGLWLGASGSSFRNIALKINEGDIQVGYDGDIGQNFIQNIGGGFGLKFVKGICVGAVRV